MAAIKSKDTGPERTVAAWLRELGLRPRRHVGNLPGRPDFVVGRLAVFVHGCFWHRCPRCALRLPRDNKPFWREKFRRNIARDRRSARALRRLGYSTITIWECRTKPRLAAASKLRLARACERSRARSSAS